jgi:hypothetical protein
MLTTDPSRPIAPLAVSLLVAMCLVAGCAAPPPADRPAPPPPPPAKTAPACEAPLEAADRAARHVVAQQDRLAALSPADLALEASRPFDLATSSPQSLVDIALALGMTRVGGDLAKGQSLLDQVIRQPGPAADPWRGIARLLAVRFAEQRRTEETAERTAALLRDTQRENQRKLDQLNDKLEALKAIERSLNTRPGASAPKPGP